MFVLTAGFPGPLAAGAVEASMCASGKKISTAFRTNQQAGGAERNDNVSPSCLTDDSSPPSSPHTFPTTPQAVCEKTIPETPQCGGFSVTRFSPGAHAAGFCRTGIILGARRDDKEKRQPSSQPYA